VLLHVDGELVLHADTYMEPAEHEVRVSVTLDGGRATVRLGEEVLGDVVGSASMLASGEVVLRVSADDDRSPVFREFPVAVLPARYRAEPVGPPEQWRAELLAHTAELRAGELFRDEVFGNTGWTGDRARGARQRAGVRVDQPPASASSTPTPTWSSTRWRWCPLWNWPRTRGRARTFLRHHRAASRFEETAPILWLCYGTGALNAAVLPATALATAGSSTTCCHALITRTSSCKDAGRDAVHSGGLPGARLGSDPRAGDPGLRHPRAQLLASSSARPNAWTGNRILPGTGSSGTLCWRCTRSRRLDDRPPRRRDRGAGR
jgi:hypothetical protein